MSAVKGAQPTNGQTGEQPGESPETHGHAGTPEEHCSTVAGRSKFFHIGKVSRSYSTWSVAIVGRPIVIRSGLLDTWSTSVFVGFSSLLLALR